MSVTSITEWAESMRISSVLLRTGECRVAVRAEYISETTLSRFLPVQNITVEGTKLAVRYTGFEVRPSRDQCEEGGENRRRDLLGAHNSYYFIKYRLEDSTKFTEKIYAGFELNRARIKFGYYPGPEGASVEVRLSPEGVENYRRPLRRR